MRAPCIHYSESALHPSQWVPASITVSTLYPLQWECPASITVSTLYLLQWECPASITVSTLYPLQWECPVSVTVRVPCIHYSEVPCIHYSESALYPLHNGIGGTGINIVVYTSMTEAGRPKKSMWPCHDDIEVRSTSLSLAAGMVSLVGTLGLANCSQARLQIYYNKSALYVPTAQHSKAVFAV